jgi:uncharacterized protein YgiM (DUF1202 family)
MAVDEEQISTNDSQEKQDEKPQVLAVNSQVNKGSLTRRHFVEVAVTASVVGTLVACEPESAAPEKPTLASLPSPENTSVEPSPTPPPIAPTSPASTVAPNRGVIGAANAPLRAGPNTTFASKETVPSGTEVYVLGRSQDGNWLEVRTPTSTKKDSVVLYDEASVGGTRVTTLSRDVELTVLGRNSDGSWLEVRTPTEVKRDNAELRSGPSTTNASVAQLSAGTQLYVLGQNPDDTWVEVMTPDGETGWVDTNDVTGEKGHVMTSKVTGETGWVQVSSFTVVAGSEVTTSVSPSIEYYPVVHDAPLVPTVRPDSNPVSPSTSHYWYPN